MTSWKTAADGLWTDPTVWDTGIVPGPTDDVTLGLATGYRALLNGSVASYSLAVSNVSALLVVVNPGGTDTFSGNVVNAGTLGLDSDAFSAEGGSTVTIAGTLTNTGQVVLGPPTGGLSAATLLTVGALAGTGNIQIHGSAAAPQAEIDVLSAAPGTIAGNLRLDGNALLRFNSGQVGTIATGVTLGLYGSAARIADVGATTTNSALAGLTQNDGTLVVANGNSIAITGNLANTGFLGLDSDAFSAEGGSSVTIAGTLTNTGQVVLGPPTGGLSAATLLTVGALAGTGNIQIHGSAAAPQAEIDVLSAAPGTIAGNLRLDGNALLRFNSGQVGTIATGVTLGLYGSAARIADVGATTTNSALAGLAQNDGTLVVANGNSIAITGNLANTGFLGLDSDAFSAEGGSSVTVAGTLTNTGQVVLGPPTGGLSAATLLTVGALAGTGSIAIHGSTAASAPPQAEIDVLSAAPGTLTGNLKLDGNALLRFNSGQLGAIATGVTLGLYGSAARISDTGATSTNSALAGLTQNDGTLAVFNGSSIAIAGSLANTGFLGLDSDGFSSEGGTTVTVAGTLTNTGQVVLGPFTGGLSAATRLTVGALVQTGSISIHGSTGTSPAQAEIDVLSAAPGTLAGNLRLDGNALLRFASGQIGTIAAGVTLGLYGVNARIADAGPTTTNSALTGLAQNDGTLAVYNGNSVAIAGSLANTGFLGLDSDGFSSEGGATVTIAGTLTNTGQVVLGPSTGTLSAATLLTVGALTGPGGIAIHGSTAATAPPQAELDVLSAAPGTLGGNLRLDGNALLRYASGQIGAIAGGVTLALYGPAARIADAGATTTNSALVGLGQNDGALVAYNGARIALAGSLASTGFLGLDSDGFSAEGGSTVTIAGTLTNTGQVVVGPARGGLSAATVLTVGALAGTGGVQIHGSIAAANPPQAEIDVLSAAPGTLAGSLGMDGNALLRFAGGQIGTIAAGATLALNGTGARVADVGATSTNSALAGLANINGTLTVYNGNIVAIAGALTNAGFLGLDSDGFSAEGGSIFTVAGTLTNTGQVVLGPSTSTLSSSDMLTVNGLANSGSVSLYGASPSIQATLLVRGAAANSGTLLVAANAVLRVAAGGVFTQTSGTTRLFGVIDAAAVNIAGGTLELDGGSVTGAIAFTSASGTIAIGAGVTAQPIGGFLLGDKIDFLGVAPSQVTQAYSATTGLTTITLGVAGGGTRTAVLAGDYSAAFFSAQQVGADTIVTTTATQAAVAVLAFGANGSPLAAGPVTIDMGTTILGGPALSLNLDVFNIAGAPADLLSGGFSIAGPGVFTNTGFGDFNGVGAGGADTAPVITLAATALGRFTETIVLRATDTSPAGVRTSLGSISATITGSVTAGPPPPPPPPPPIPTAIAWGDVHMTTFDGLGYTFQAAGEFVLA